jgi:hypothetical protein
LERDVDEAAYIFCATPTGGKPTIDWLVSRTYDGYEDEYAAQFEVQADVVSEPGDVPARRHAVRDPVTG